jgi:hypothetical protein
VTSSDSDHRRANGLQSNVGGSGLPDGRLLDDTPSPMLLLAAVVFLFRADFLKTGSPKLPTRPLAPALSGPRVLGEL